MRFKNAANIVHEMRHWYEKGHKSFYFGGGNSLANGPLLRKCIEELEAQELSINICLVGRPEDVLRHDDVLEYIFQNPTIRPYVIELGIEADTQHLLDLLGRKVTPEINRKAVQSLLALRAKYSPRTKILANMILFSHYDMTIEDFIANVRFIGEHQCSQEVMTLSLCGFANTPIWQDMRNRGFQPQPLKGLQIFDYPFSDDIVNKLFKKFSHHLYEQLTKKKTSASFWDYKAVQKQMHDKIMDFYASDDVMKRIMTFLESADFTG